MESLGRTQPFKFALLLCAMALAANSIIWSARFCFAKDENHSQFYDKKYFVLHQKDFERIGATLKAHPRVSEVTLLALSVKVGKKSSRYARTSVTTDTWRCETDSTKSQKDLLNESQFSLQEFNGLMARLKNIECGEAISDDVDMKGNLSLMFVSIPEVISSGGLSTRFARILFIPDSAHVLTPKWFESPQLKATPLSHDWFLMERKP